VQLKHQLKNQEIESEHSRQKDSLVSQKALQEARSTFERLLTEKTELEIRFAKLEERNKASQREADELVSKLKFLEDEKHSSTAKWRELEFSHQQLELQIKTAQQKEIGASEVIVVSYIN